MFLRCPKTFHLFLLFLFFFIVHFLLVENTYKNPYSLKAVNKKTRVFERACIMAKKGAICPIFEGDMPPKKYTPKTQCR
jgi:hypothetical protein